MSEDMFNKGPDDTQQIPVVNDDGKILPDTQPVSGFEPDGQRAPLGKLGLAIAAVVMGVALVVAFAFGSEMNTQTTSSSTDTGHSIERPIESVTPSNTVSVSPEPSQTTSSKAPTAPITQKPTETPVKTAEPTVKPTAKCEVDARSPHYAGDNYVGKEAVKVLIKQNMDWNEVYSGEFHFPSQQDQHQTMTELYRNMDRHGPERAGFDFFLLYSYNAKTISQRLQEVDGPCKKLADVDRSWIEGIPDLFDDPEASSTNPAFLAKLNKYAAQWLNMRNAVLK